MSQPTPKIALKITPAVARLVAKNAPRDMQLAAARGAIQLQAGELLTAWLFLIHGKDPELKAAAQ
jgi:hypothetical protein